MSTTEILAELPKLSPDERRQVYQRLCELQERDLLQGMEPSPDEKRLLDAAMAQYEKDGNQGRPWRDVLQDLREKS